MGDAIGGPFSPYSAARAFLGKAKDWSQTTDTKKIPRLGKGIHANLVGVSRL